MNFQKGQNIPDRLYVINHFNTTGFTYLLSADSVNTREIGGSPCQERLQCKAKLFLADPDKHCCH